jgi:hypothetical protein
MQNRAFSFRNWYIDKWPIADYRVSTYEPKTRVLEAAVMNYEIVGTGKLSHQIVLKMIDPSDRRVIGRATAANAWSMPDLNP